MTEEVSLREMYSELRRLEATVTHFQNQVLRQQIAIEQFSNLILVRSEQAQPAQPSVLVGLDESVEDDVDQEPIPEIGYNPAFSVVSFVLEAAEELGDRVVDWQILKLRATELHPEHSLKIKRGIYNALNSLCKKGEMKRVPGGFKLSRFVSLPATATAA